MTDEAALLAEIVARPDDDAPRLVLADLLTARGDPRGELIALQCRLAAAPDDAARRSLRIAENKLLAAHGEAWSAPVKALLPPNAWDIPKIVWVRGFVEHVATSTGLLDRLDDLFSAAPLVRSLKLWGPMVLPDADPVSLAGLSHPRLEQLHSLDLHVLGAGNAGAAAVASAPLRGLRTLSLQLSILETADTPAHARRPLDVDGVLALAASPHLAGVRALDLSYNELGAAAVDALGGARFRLEELDLSGRAFDAAAAERLAASPSFATLRRLRLRGADLGVEGAATLARAPLPDLEELDLSETRLGPDAAEAFFGALTLPRLRTLRLERGRLGDRGLRALLASPALPRLVDLELGHNDFTKEGARLLAESPTLAHVERLLLNEGRWRPPTVELLTTSKTLARCKLYLRGKLVGKRA